MNKPSNLEHSRLYELWWTGSSLSASAISSIAYDTDLSLWCMLLSTAWWLCGYGKFCSNLYFPASDLSLIAWGEVLKLGRRGETKGPAVLFLCISDVIFDNTLAVNLLSARCPCQNLFVRLCIQYRKTASSPELRTFYICKPLAFPWEVLSVLVFRPLLVWFSCWFKWRLCL